MFSLIITVIAIALVAILALATLYYGGSAFGKGASRAEASKVLLQGQQLLGAADLFYSENRRWPHTIDELVSDKYLKQIPSAQASGLSDALAAGTQWQMVADAPTFYTPTAAMDVCAEVNLAASLKKRGVLKQAYSSLVAQCYGQTSLTTVFRKDSTSDFPAGTDLAASATPPTDPADSAWSMAPGSTVPANPGGGGSGGVVGPSASISPSSWSATTTPLTPSTKVFTVTNSTSAQVEVWWQWFDDGSRFSFDSSSSNDCSNNWRLDPGESCTYTVTFDGVAPATDTMYVEIGNANGDYVDLPVNLQGSVQAADVMATAPVQMPNPIDVGTATNTVTVPVTNIGTATVVVDSVSTTPPFLGDTGTGPGSCAVAGSIAPGQSCNLSVTIVPGDTDGQVSGMLIVTGTSGSKSWTAVADLTGVTTKAPLPPPAPTNAMLTDYATCTQPIFSLKFDLATGQTEPFCASGKGARGAALRNSLQNESSMRVWCGRSGIYDNSNPAYYFYSFRVEGSDGYRFQLSTRGYDTPYGQPDSDRCPLGFGGGYLNMYYTDYFITYQTWNEGLDLQFICSSGDCSGTGGGGSGGGLGGGSGKTDYVTQAGVNLYEVPVHTPWSGSCGVGTTGNASQYNTCAAAATRIGGAFSSCQVIANEPSPSGAGTYQSRISCSK